MKSFPPEIVDAVLDRLSRGETLRQACRGEGFPHQSTVCNWARTDPEFAERYHAARTIGYHVMADEIVDIADDSTDDYVINERTGRPNLNKEAVLRSRLRVDARKWLLAKALPRVYGDRQSLEVSGPDGKPLAVGILGVIQKLPQAEVQRIAALPADEAKAELLRLMEGDGA